MIIIFLLKSYFFLLLFFWDIVVDYDGWIIVIQCIVYNYNWVIAYNTSCFWCFI